MGFRLLVPLLDHQLWCYRLSLDFTKKACLKGWPR